MSDMRQELVDCGVRVSELGMSPGTSGNLSIRDGNRILMTPSGVSLSDLSVDRLSVLDLTAVLLDGPSPSKEVPFHRAFYRRSDETRAVVHLHSSHATAQSCLPPWSEHSALPPITPYLIMRVGQVPLVPYAAPGDSAQAETIQAMPFAFTSALLGNHGQVSSGSSLEQALERAVEIEECSKLLSFIGNRLPRILKDDQIDQLVRRYGAPWEVQTVSRDSP